MSSFKNQQVRLNMKKIITTLSAMTLTMQAGSIKSETIDFTPVTLEDLEVIYTDDASFKASGFINLQVEKTVHLARDTDGSGTVTLGDELYYYIRVLNLNSTIAHGIVLKDPLHSSLELIRGSVGITQGTVDSGNGPYDPLNGVKINFGDINYEAKAEFFVTIVNLNPGNNVIWNSAYVYDQTGSYNFISDDPTTPTVDPTMIDACGSSTSGFFIGDDFYGKGPSPSGCF